VRRTLLRWSFIITVLVLFVLGPFAYRAVRQSFREHQRRAEVKRNLDGLSDALDRYERAKSTNSADEK
jgi:hypothetical protein